MIDSFTLARSSLLAVYSNLHKSKFKTIVGRANIDLDRCIRIMEKEKESKYVQAIKEAFVLEP